MELQLVQTLVPLPDEIVRQKVINAFNPVDYERNYLLLKQWFEDETQTVCNENYQNQIHVFLRGTKNDLSRAKRRLRCFFLNKESGKFPEWYQYYDLQYKYEQFKNFYVLCQPGTTPEGHRISCLGFSTPGIENFEPDILFQSLFMIDHLGLCLGHHYFVGVISIIDCRYATTRHALKILSWTFRRYGKFQNETMPYRLVKLYMINVPKYIEKFVQIGKTFLREKLRSRFCIEQSDAEMRREIPKECLPSDYGGLGESVERQTEKWFDLLQTLRPWFEAEQDVRLRPRKPATGALTSSMHVNQEQPLHQRSCMDNDDDDQDVLIANTSENEQNAKKQARRSRFKPCKSLQNTGNDQVYNENETTTLNFSFKNIEID